MKPIAVLFQIVSIILLGAFTGAMIMLYTAILSFWKKTTPQDFLDWYDSYASGIMDATGPLVMASIGLPLICFVLVIKNRESRIYWLGSFLLSVIIMIITLSYFVDINTSFSDQTIKLGKIKETLKTWGDFHLIRILLAFISTLFATIGLVKHISSKRQID